MKASVLLSNGRIGSEWRSPYTVVPAVGASKLGTRVSSVSSHSHVRSLSPKLDARLGLPAKAKPGIAFLMELRLGY